MESILLARPTATIPTNLTLVARASRAAKVVAEKRQGRGDPDAYLRYDVTIPPKLVESLGWASGDALGVEVARGKLRLFRRE